MKKTILYTALVSTVFSMTACKGGNADSSSGGTQSGDAIELKFNLKEGSKYAYTVDMQQQTAAMGQQGKTNMLMEYTYEIKGADGANKILNVTYDRMKMEADMGGQKMAFDSKDPASANSPFASAGSIVGKSFSMTVAPDGSIVKVDDFSKLLPAGSAGIDEQTIKQMMETSLNIYPDKPVKPGDSWKKTSKFNMQMMTMTMDATYTLDKVAGGKAYLKVDSKLTLDQGAQKQEMQMSFDGKQSGTLEVEIATGQLLSGKMQQTIGGKVSAMGKEVPLEMKSDINMTGKKL